MYCPSCKDEFRPGFTRCANCNVDLVDRLAEAGRGPADQGPAAAAHAEPAIVPMTEFCGFLSLDEARGARGRLRRDGIRSEILIRESPGPPGGEQVEEEYWLRVDRAHFQHAVSLLGIDPVEETEAEDESFDCGACGHRVNANEEFCPHCGARFEDD